MGDGGVRNNIRATPALSQVYERAFIKFKSSSPEKISDPFSRSTEERLLLQAKQPLPDWTPDWITDIQQVRASLNKNTGSILNYSVEGQANKSQRQVIEYRRTGGCWLVAQLQDWDLGAASSPSDVYSTEVHTGLIVLSTISSTFSNSVEPIIRLCCWFPKPGLHMCVAHRKPGSFIVKEGPIIPYRGAEWTNSSVRFLQSQKPRGLSWEG